MLPTTRYWILFSSLAGLVLSVSASLYPTNPISRTVWSAGRSENISWIDDGKYPYLNDMGVLNIELYVAGNTHITTLASRIDPKSRSLKVKISPFLGHNGSFYHLRFVSEQPPMTIYSADFTITNMTIVLPRPQTKLSHSKSPQTLPLERTWRRPGPTPTTAYSTSLSIPTSTGDSYTPVQQEPDPGPQIPMRNDAGGTSTRRVDMEKLKFRLVFILWPAMIGLTMAL